MDNSNPNKGITFAGEYILDEFAILKADSDLAVDVRNQLNAFYIYEDMYSPLITGTAVIRDTLDLPSLFGRGGKNLLRIKVRTPSYKSIEGFFHLYKIGDQSLVKERTQVYTLNFVSLESMTDTSLHISKRFIGSPSQIAEDIYQTHLKTEKTITVSPSSNRTAYVSNYWSAITNLAFLADNALSDKNTADFVAFENRDGMNFVSVQSIFSQPILQDFIQTDYLMTEVAPGSTSVVRDINLEFKQIQTLNVSHYYDFITDNDSGVVNSRSLIHDIVRKQYEVRDLSQRNDVKPLLNPNRLYTDKVIDSVRPRLIPTHKHFGLFEPEDLSNARFLSRRIMHSKMLMGQKIEIDVMGRADYTVGKRVKLTINELKNITSDMSDGDIKNKMLSGYYIITAIAHKFDGRAHTCKMELMKDSVVST